MAKKKAHAGNVKAGEYRRSVGIMLLDRDNRVLVCRRSDQPDAAWQMPQGGIDADEDPRGAALRELEEEVGTANAEILAESREWYSYDLPPEIRAKSWRGRYRGQTQKWFALRFRGTDADFKLDGPHPEFNEWRWVEPDELPGLIVAFKRPVYERVLEEFRSLFVSR